MVKIFSMTREPVRMDAVRGPTYVMTGMRLFRSAWTKMTFQCATPFARAVRM